MDKKKINILLVDDTSENLFMLESLLESPELDIFKAMSGADALDMSIKHEFALVLLDVRLPDIDGFQVAERIRATDKACQTPIIFVTESKDKSDMFKGYDSGAVDYLFKPLDPHILKSKVNIFLELYRQKRSLQRLSDQLIRNLEELKHSKELVKQKNKTLSDLVIHDSLTRLYNRRHLDVVIEQEFNRAKRHNTELSCLLMDLDFFKQINDKFGHACGDYVLIEFAALLRKHLRRSDFVFRYGGEEFLVLLPQTDLNGAHSRAEKIRKYCELRKFKERFNTVTVTVSIGIASVAAHHVNNVRELIAYADKALYRAKAEGRNRVKSYLDQLSDFVHGVAVSKSKDFEYFKENLSSILDKTKSAALNSLELLVNDMGGNRFQHHNRRVLQYLELIGQHMQLPSQVINNLKRAAMLHDSFKVLLSESFSDKNESLNSEEWNEIHDHPYMLVEMTDRFDFFSHEREILLYHHEKYDGSGYPMGLTGEQIPYGARLLAVIDALVAMTSKRSYRKRLTIQEAVKELKDKSGSQFDPKIVDEVLSLVGSKPKNRNV